MHSMQTNNPPTSPFTPDAGAGATITDLPKDPPAELILADRQSSLPIAVIRAIASVAHYSASDQLRFSPGSASDNASPALGSIEDSCRKIDKLNDAPQMKQGVKIEMPVTLALGKKDSESCLPEIHSGVTSPNALGKKLENAGISCLLEMKSGVAQKADKNGPGQEKTEKNDLGLKISPSSTDLPTETLIAPNSAGAVNKGVTESPDCDNKAVSKPADCNPLEKAASCPAPAQTKIIPDPARKILEKGEKFSSSSLITKNHENLAEITKGLALETKNSSEACNPTEKSTSPIKKCSLPRENMKESQKGRSMQKRDRYTACSPLSPHLTDFDEKTAPLLPILSILALIQLLFNSLSPLVVSQVCQMLGDEWFHGPRLYLATYQLLYYYGIRLALQSILSCPNDTITTIHELLPIPLDLSCINGVPPFIRRLNAYVLTLASTSTIILAPMKWMKTSKNLLSIPNSLHRYANPSTSWGEDIIHHYDRIKIPPLYDGILQLSLVQWGHYETRLPNLFRDTKNDGAWTEYDWETWCFEPSIEASPYCANERCGCHRGGHHMSNPNDPYCSRRCKNPSHHGCQRRKSAHVKFYGEFSAFLIDHPTHRPPPWCATLPMLSSTKFPDVAPYTLLIWNGFVHEPARDENGKIVPPRSPLGAMHVAPTMIEREPSHPLELETSTTTRIEELKAPTSSSPQAKTGPSPPLPLVVGVEVARMATLPSLSQLEVMTLQAALKLNERLREVGASRRHVSNTLQAFTTFTRDNAGSLDFPTTHVIGATFGHLYEDLVNTIEELIRDGALGPNTPYDDTHLLRTFRQLFEQHRPHLRPTRRAVVVSQGIPSDEICAMGVEPSSPLEVPLAPTIDEVSLASLPTLLVDGFETSTPFKPLSSDDLHARFPTMATPTQQQWDYSTLIEEETPTWLSSPQVNNKSGFDWILPFQLGLGRCFIMSGAPMRHEPFASRHAPPQPSLSPQERKFVEPYFQVGEHWISYDHTIGVLVLRLRHRGIDLYAIIDHGSKFSIMSHAYYQDLQTQGYRATLETAQSYHGVAAWGGTRLWTQKFWSQPVAIADYNCTMDCYVTDPHEDVNFSFILGRDWLDQHRAIVGTRFSPFQLLLDRRPLGSFYAPLHVESPTQDLQVLTPRGISIARHRVEQSPIDHQPMLIGIARARPFATFGMDDHDRWGAAFRRHLTFQTPTFESDEDETPTKRPRAKCLSSFDVTQCPVCRGGITLLGHEMCIRCLKPPRPRGVQELSLDRYLDDVDSWERMNQLAHVAHRAQFALVTKISPSTPPSSARDDQPRPSTSPPPRVCRRKPLGLSMFIGLFLTTTMVPSIEGRSPNVMPLSEFDFFDPLAPTLRIDLKPLGTHVRHDASPLFQFDQNDPRSFPRRLDVELIAPLFATLNATPNDLARPLRRRPHPQKPTGSNTFSPFDTLDLGFCGWSAPTRAPYNYEVLLKRPPIPITWSLMDPRVK